MDCYDLILDLYPLLSDFPAEAAVLQFRIERTALDALEEKEGALSRLRLLLRMARDLGYLDDRLWFFLEKRITQSISP